jgi:hypothetical protein
MTPPPRQARRQQRPTETPEAIRARLDAFARVTRERAERRKTLPEPSVAGTTWVGRQVRGK